MINSITIVGAGVVGMATASYLERDHTRETRGSLV